MDQFNNFLNSLEIKNAIQEFCEQLDNYKGYCKMVAMQEKAYYDALIEEGFKEEQALRIVAEQGIFVGRLDNN